ncbi:MAG: DegT/DnrJ/EryC1/StrS family aminotransferase [Phycisphaeraceae bacterium]|nr:DegT/DnrJ/EryC1/StrS family aminotransferase [Phycisphaeraceae bacterium]
MPVVERVLDGQYMINGPEVGEFERQAAGYCDTKFAVGCSSGTDALILAMMALEIKPGDEVITSPFTFFATVGSIHRHGAKPAFVDIDPGTLNFDTEQLEEAVNEKTRAIAPVHLFGQMADMDTVLDVAEKHDLKIIEDSAQSIGSKQNGAPSGSLGDVGCFSFFPSKNLGGAGDGGLCTTQDEEVYERLKMLRMHGGKQRYYHDEVGGNFRLDTLQAAYLSVKLKHLDNWHEGRRRNAAFYDEHLAEVEEVTTPIIAEGNESIYNQYTLRVQQRDELQAFLGEAGVGSAIYYPLCMHEQKCFAYLGHSTGDFPIAEQAAAEVLSIPIYPELKEEQLAHVVETVKSFYA